MKDNWQTERDQPIDVPLATGVGLVLGKMSSGIVDVDIDDTRILPYLKLPKTLTWSRDGAIRHHLFRCPDNWKSRRFTLEGRCVIELRGDGCQTMIPPSLHPNGTRLSWDSKEQTIETIQYNELLELICNAMRRLKNSLGIKDYTPPSNTGVSGTVDTIERATNYVSKMNPAISGSGGHAATFRVALALLKGFDLPYHQAWPIMAWYNANRCFPPWSVSELRHKMDEALKARVEPGYLNKRRTR